MGGIALQWATSLCRMEIYGDGNGTHSQFIASFGAKNTSTCKEVIRINHLFSRLDSTKRPWGRKFPKTIWHGKHPHTHCLALMNGIPPVSISTYQLAGAIPPQLSVKVFDSFGLDSARSCRAQRELRGSKRPALATGPCCHRSLASQEAEWSGHGRGGAFKQSLQCTVVLKVACHAGYMRTSLSSARHSSCSAVAPVHGLVKS